MSIKNISVVHDEGVDSYRSAIENRATWMALMYLEAQKEGVDMEPIMRRAINTTGTMRGQEIKQACMDSTDCRQFQKAFVSNLNMTSFQHNITTCDADDYKVDFYYCPLVSAWQKLGLDDETCALLCDIAMEGDRAIARTVGLTMELGDTIANGGCCCQLHFHKSFNQSNP